MEENAADGPINNDDSPEKDEVVEQKKELEEEEDEYEDEEYAEEEDDDDEEEQEHKFQNTLSFHDLWTGSSTFKLILVAVVVTSVLAITGAIIAFYTLGSEGVALAVEEEYTSWVQTSYQDCMSTESRQEGVINDLNAKLNNATNMVNNLKRIATDLTRQISDLNQKIYETESATNSTKGAAIYWKIGTGVGGALSLAAGSFALYKGIELGGYNSEKDSIASALNFLKARLLSAMSMRSGYTIMQRNACYLEKTACYSSMPDYYFSKEKLRNDCSGEAAFAIEMTNDMKESFGVYFYGNMSKDSFYDSNAFVYIIKDGTIGESKKINTPFHFPTDKMLIIGEQEISVYESKFAPAKVRTVPGDSFIVGSSTYHTNTEFYIERMNVYRLEIKCPKL